MSKIAYLVSGYLCLILLLQTLYRWIYYQLPWGINTHPSQEYLNAMNFFEPNNLSILVTIFFGVLLLIIIFDTDGE